MFKVTVTIEQVAGPLSNDLGQHQFPVLTSGENTPTEDTAQPSGIDKRTSVSREG
jgi:hypothetical protein